MMDKKCIRCGSEIPESLLECPSCKAPVNTESVVIELDALPPILGETLPS